MTVSGCPDAAALQQMALGKLPDEELKKVAGHIETCPLCARNLVSLRAHDALTEASRARKNAGIATDPAVEKLIAHLEEVTAQVSKAGPEATVAGNPAARLKDGAAADHPPAAPADFSFLAPPKEPGEIGYLGQYRVLKLLGQGGMGMVFQAEDPLLQRPVALKVMLPKVASDEAFRQRFLREAQATAAVISDYIVTIYQVDVANGVPYLAMKLLQGETLDALQERIPQPPTKVVVRVGKEIALGLAAAHDKGLIHRDIKPANIWLEKLDSGIGDSKVGLQGSASKDGSAVLLNTNFRVKILDFGLARPTAGQRLTQTGMILGTPSYMAPEQARGDQLDARTDLFSLGAVLYGLCAGQLPFKANDTISTLVAIANDAPKPLLEVNPALPPPLAHLIMRMLAKKPADRPQSAHEVVKQLEAIEQGEDKTPPEGSQQIKLGRPGASRRKAALIAACVILPMLLGGVIYSFMNGSSRPPIGTGPGSNGAGPREPKRDDPPVQKDPVVAQPVLPGKEFTNSLGMKMAPIRPGKFVMGSPAAEIERCCKLQRDAWVFDFFRSEGPQHEVEISQPFHIGATEVTVGQFRKFVDATRHVMGDDRWLRPGWLQTDEHPVVFVSWDEAMAFCKWLSGKEGKKYTLPTEAQWEYCCRAGKASRYAFGDDEADLGEYAWHASNSQGRTQPVAQRKPNAWGLHDMHGNAYEWCLDKFDANYYRESPKKDPPGLASDREMARAFRGGSFYTPPAECRSAFRRCYVPDHHMSELGFRVVLLPGVVEPTPKQPDLPPPKIVKGPIADLLTAPDWEWSAPENLGAAINSGRQIGPSLSADERILIFWRGGKLWECRRKSIAEPFGQPEALPQSINSNVLEIASISGDGLSLAFTSTRGGGPGDIWISNRKSLADPFGEPARMPEPVNSPARECDPCLSADALTLLVTTTRHRAQGAVVMFTRRTQAEAFGNETLLPESINSAKYNIANWISDDRHVLLSTPMPGQPPFVPRMHVRPSLDVPFGPGKALGTPFHLPNSTGRTWLSQDGQRIYFHSRGLPGGIADVDLWMCRRVTKRKTGAGQEYKNALDMEFVVVPKGKAWLGGRDGKPGDRQVEFKQDFYLGRYEVTQEEWLKVMEFNPSRSSRLGENSDAVKDVSDADLRRLPVDGVSWDDCQEFIKRLNEKSKERGWVYRLPTADEWEYACRGGPIPQAESGFDFYLDVPTSKTLPSNKANIAATGLKRPCTVGSYPPNRLGLHDMHGNVFEFCHDQKAGSKGEPLRLMRGGCFPDGPEFCLASGASIGTPGGRYNGSGLRLARVPSAP